MLRLTTQAPNIAQQQEFTESIWDFVEREYPQDTWYIVYDAIDAEVELTWRPSFRGANVPIPMFGYTIAANHTALSALLAQLSILATNSLAAEKELLRAHVSLAAPVMETIDDSGDICWIVYIGFAFQVPREPQQI